VAPRAYLAKTRGKSPEPRPVGTPESAKPSRRGCQTPIKRRRHRSTRTLHVFLSLNIPTRCMSFQPCLFSHSAVFSASISPRAACLFSLHALHVFSAFPPLFSPTRCMSFQPCLFSPSFQPQPTRCMSFQPFSPFSPSPRAACLFSPGITLYRHRGEIGSRDGTRRVVQGQGCDSPAGTSGSISLVLD
jgi:hypothetical protein